MYINQIIKHNMKIWIFIKNYLGYNSNIQTQSWNHQNLYIISSDSNYTISLNHIACHMIIRTTIPSFKEFLSIKIRELNISKKNK
jgi:hypothetical protein